jgi:hypothetical protein
MVQSSKAWVGIVEWLPTLYLIRVTGGVERFKGRIAHCQHPTLWNPESAEPRLLTERGGWAEVFARKCGMTPAHHPYHPRICDEALSVGHHSD